MKNHFQTLRLHTLKNMSSPFRPNKPIEPMIMDFMWEEPHQSWLYTNGSAILLLATCMIIYLMCIIWRFSILRVERRHL